MSQNIFTPDETKRILRVKEWFTNVVNSSSHYFPDHLPSPILLGGGEILRSDSAIMTHACHAVYLNYVGVSDHMKTLVEHPYTVAHGTRPLPAIFKTIHKVVEIDSPIRLYVTHSPANSVPELMGLITDIRMTPYFVYSRFLKTATYRLTRRAFDAILNNKTS